MLATGALEPPSPQAVTSAAIAMVQKRGAIGVLYFDISVLVCCRRLADVFGKSKGLM